MISRIATLFAVVGIVFSAGEARAAFVFGVNLSGAAVTIAGNPWQSEATASSNGFSFETGASFVPFTYSAVPTPAVDADTAAMLMDVRYIPFGGLSAIIHQSVPSGQAYLVELWTYEGYSDFAREASVSGDISTSNFGLLPLGGWEARSLTTGIINDGSIDFTLTTVNNQPVLSGFAIYTTVPEPAAGTLLVLGLMVKSRRRRRA